MCLVQWQSHDKRHHVDMKALGSQLPRPLVHGAMAEVELAGKSLISITFQLARSPKQSVSIIKRNYPRVTSTELVWKNASKDKTKIIYQLLGLQKVHNDVLILVKEEGLEWFRSPALVGLEKSNGLHHYSSELNTLKNKTRNQTWMQRSHGASADLASQARRSEKDPRQPSIVPADAEFAPEHRSDVRFVSNPSTNPNVLSDGGDIRAGVAGMCDFISSSTDALLLILSDILSR